MDVNNNFVALLVHLKWRQERVNLNEPPVRKGRCQKDPTVVCVRCF